MIYGNNEKHNIIDMIVDDFAIKNARGLCINELSNNLTFTVFFETKSKIYSYNCTNLHRLIARYALINRTNKN